MSISKNQIIPLQIESLSNDGSGIGHYCGEAVFVPGSVPGDSIQVRIVKDCKRYAFGIVESILEPSPDRLAPDCAAAAPCGGCCFRHIVYTAEVAAKGQFVQDAFTRIGAFSLKVLPCLPSPQTERYRNKAQYPVGRDANGRICAGFYAGRTHRIVPCADCLLQPQIFSDITTFLCHTFDALGIEPYDETTGSGMIRHIFLRTGIHTGELMVCLVAAVPELPRTQELVQNLCARFPAITTILLNVNAQRTNVILGRENHTLFGPGYIADTMCGVPIRLGPLSFYQVNTPAAEQLYGIAAEYAALRPEDRLLDLYCGMGTIGLSMASRCAQLVGVEVIPEAVDAAKMNAQAMGSAISAKCRFLCADAGTAARQLCEEGLAPDVVVLDPPRKGCDETTLNAVLQMAPRRIVMVSCYPATAARDCRYLADRGYTLRRVQPADMFPRTKHVETVVLMTRSDAGDAE